MNLQILRATLRAHDLSPRRFAAIGRLFLHFFDLRFSRRLLINLRHSISRSRVKLDQKLKPTARELRIFTASIEAAKWAPNEMPDNWIDTSTTTSTVHEEGDKRYWAASELDCCDMLKPKICRLQVVNRNSTKWCMSVSQQGTSCLTVSLNFFGLHLHVLRHPKAIISIY